MPNLSKRFLRGRPMRVTTTATLPQIQAALSARPNLTALRGGWGSIEEDPDIIGAIGVQPPATDPGILPAIPGRRPDVLAARLYWYRPVNTRVPGASPQSQLDATDILLSEEGNGDYLLFVATHTERQIINSVIPELRRAISFVDGNVAISTVTSAVDLKTPDFFLWLVRQSFRKKPIIGLDIEIDEMERVRCYDPLSYETRIGRGANEDRLELITMLANSIKVFGPATFTVTATALNAAFEFELATDGSIDITVPSLSYPGAGFTNIEEMRVRAVTDLLYVLLPAMKSQYEGDTGWTSGVDRNKFRAKMKKKALAGVKNL